MRKFIAASLLALLFLGEVLADSGRPVWPNQLPPTAEPKPPSPKDDWVAFGAIGIALFLAALGIVVAKYVFNRRNPPAP